MTTRTFIWGSCVSRDTFEYLPADHELVGYVARQSWLSTDRPAEPFDLGDITSDFQRRMTLGDAAGNAMDRIRERADEIDLLLLDLCDERLGIVDLGAGGVVTRSVEKIASGAQLRLDDQGRALSFGEEEHYERWARAADDIHRQLQERDLLAKTLVLAPEWAMFDDEAKATPTSFGMTAVEMNAAYQRYYDALGDVGFTVVRLGPTIASAAHKWGRAPFHYHDSVYEELVGAIRESH